MSLITDALAQQYNQAESEEGYINRAAEFAEKAYKGFSVPGREMVPFMTHVVEVVYLMSRITQDPATLAAAWLHDTVSINRASYEEIAKEFGYVVAGLVRLSTEKRDDPLEHFKVIEDNPTAVNLVLADYIASVRNSAVIDWVAVRGMVASLKQLAFNEKGDERLRRVAKVTVQETENYLNNVIKDTPETCHRLSTGHPATLGIYRMLSIQSWSPECPAVKYLTKEIEKYGVSKEVMLGEMKVLDVLQALNKGEEACIDWGTDA